MKFLGCYLFSDIDGTLGTASAGIPRRNIDALQYFVANGGTFGLCTGRWVTDIKHFVSEVNVNGISIVNNGGAFYDYATGKYFGVRTLPQYIGEYLRCMLREDDRLEAITIIESGQYRIAHTKSLPVLPVDDFNYKLMKFEDIHAPHLKLLFYIGDGTAGEKAQLWNDWGLPGVDFVQTSDICVEMLPKGINKGSALMELCKMRGIPLGRTWFIGDSYNDREIFQTAGYSACVAETPPELQRLCDCVLGPCADGVLADFIHVIETGQVLYA